MRTATDTTTTVRAISRSGVELVVVNDGLWRVRARDGRILGHIERLSSAAGDTFVAKRFSPVRTTFLSLGQFWNMQDAIDCLR